MLDPALEKLLILQDRDMRRAELETNLKRVPLDIQLVEKKIADEKAAIEQARNELRELETRKRSLETEIASSEQTLGKYRTQQLGVRKNDEYQALGHEIDNVQKQIGEMEGRELEVMFAIDFARKRFAEAEHALQANIAGHEERIRILKERGENLTRDLEAARATVAEARAPVPPPLLRAYDRLAAHSLPAVVPIRGAKCGGCHLKVSSEVESAVRGRLTDGQPITCDQCGRIVYWEAA